MSKSEITTTPDQPTPAQAELLQRMDWMLENSDAYIEVEVIRAAAAEIRAQAAALAEQEAEVTRLRGRIIAEQSREIARIEAEIAVLAAEFDKVDPKHWARFQSLEKLIDALYDQKNAIKCVADWRAVADQDRRQALTPTQEDQQ